MVDIRNLYSRNPLFVHDDLFQLVYLRWEFGPESDIFTQPGELFVVFGLEPRVFVLLFLFCYAECRFLAFEDRKGGLANLELALQPLHGHLVELVLQFHGSPPHSPFQ